MTKLRQMRRKSERNRFSEENVKFRLQISNLFIREYVSPVPTIVINSASQNFRLELGVSHSMFGFLDTALRWKETNKENLPSFAIERLEMVLNNVYVRATILLDDQALVADYKTFGEMTERLKNAQPEATEQEHAEALEEVRNLQTLKEDIEKDKPE